MDNVGPQVVVTKPDTLQSWTISMDQSNYFSMNESAKTVSTGTLQEVVTISPMLGEIKVRHGSRSLEVEMEGGFPSDMVYRVTVLPRVRDLFRMRCRIHSNSYFRLVQK